MINHSLMGATSVHPYFNPYLLIMTEVDSFYRNDKGAALLALMYFYSLIRIYKMMKERCKTNLR